MKIYRDREAVVQLHVCVCVGGEMLQRAATQSRLLLAPSKYQTLQQTPFSTMLEILKCLFFKLQVLL